MSSPDPSRRLTLVVCAAPLADRAGHLVDQLTRSGWTVTVAATANAEHWLGGDPIGAPVIVNYRDSDQARDTGRAAAVVVAPMTLNTANKAAAGIADTYAMSVLAEAIATTTPTVAVPVVNRRLWTHSAFQRSLDWLTTEGVTLLDPHTGQPPPRPVESGTGADVASRFDPAWIARALAGQMT